MEVSRILMTLGRCFWPLKWKYLCCVLDELRQAIYSTNRTVGQNCHLMCHHGLKMTIWNYFFCIFWWKRTPLGTTKWLYFFSKWIFDYAMTAQSDLFFIFYFSFSLLPGKPLILLSTSTYYKIFKKADFCWF